MQVLRRADNRFGRACGHAQRAADAALEIDLGDFGRNVSAAGFVEREYFPAEQLGETINDGVSARRAAVVFFSAGDRAGVIGAVFIAALTALRLRQD